MNDSINPLINHYLQNYKKQIVSQYNIESKSIEQLSRNNKKSQKIQKRNNRLIFK